MIDQKTDRENNGMFQIKSKINEVTIVEVILPLQHKKERTKSYVKNGKFIPKVIVDK